MILILPYAMADEFLERNNEFSEDNLPEYLRLLKPREPLPDECCGSGCNVCVNDIYEQELKIWRKECDDYRRRCSIGFTLNDDDPPIFTDKYVKFPLLHVSSHTRNSNIYRFTFTCFKILGFKPGQHLIMRGQVNGLSYVREYTPISPHDAEGYFDVLIKLYENGKMSQYVASWHIGIEIEWRGPQGSFEYQPNTFGNIYMLAAGTGITPMIQVIRSVLNNENDETFLHLMFACSTYEDILMKKELNEFKRFWNFKLTYYLSKDSSGHTHYGENIVQSHITMETLSEKLSTEKNLVLICGTRSFNSDMEKYIKELGFKKEQYYIF